MSPSQRQCYSYFNYSVFVLEKHDREIKRKDFKNIQLFFQYLSTTVFSVSFNAHELC